MEQAKESEPRALIEQGITKHEPPKEPRRPAIVDRLACLAGSLLLPRPPNASGRTEWEG
jgi:hypothetical protein